MTHRGFLLARLSVAFKTQAIAGVEEASYDPPEGVRVADDDMTLRRLPLRPSDHLLRWTRLAVSLGPTTDRDRRPVYGRAYDAAAERP